MSVSLVTRGVIRSDPWTRQNHFRGVTVRGRGVLQTNIEEQVYGIMGRATDSLEVVTVGFLLTPGLPYI